MVIIPLFFFFWKQLIMTKRLFHVFLPLPQFLGKKDQFCSSLSTLSSDHRSRAVNRDAGSRIVDDMSAGELLGVEPIELRFPCKQPVSNFPRPVTFLRYFGVLNVSFSLAERSRIEEADHVLSPALQQIGGKCCL